MDGAVDDERTVRDLLPHAWYPFFGRFGRLTPIQRRAVRPIVRGEPVLLTAPTASGKTEAALAPLVERLLAGDTPRAGLAIVVVTPTRALANDLHRRLAGPLRRAGVGLDLKTGDAPGFDDDAPPGVLVTTPESLDSMLSRRPRALRTVQAVVCDELHLLDRSARGDQLRCLLARLDQVAPGVQRCAASATVPDTGALARRFLGPEARMVTGGGEAGRAIDADVAEARTLEEAADAVMERFTSGGARKLLVFTNVRAEVEALTALLSGEPRLRSRVFAHHGSLSRDERLRVEGRFLDAPRAVCVATMTLELGVDIGDVDRVVLLSPPPNVSSLVQRVGRANRGEATTRVTCLHDGAFERTRFEHLLECAAAGTLFEDSVALRPTVVAQQALSLLLQNPKGWISVEALHGRLAPDAASLWAADDCEAILGQMAEAGWLRAVDRGRFVAEERATQAFEYGRMHSLIASSPEVEVVDEVTGRPVGRARVSASERDALASGGDVALSLGGKRREVTRIRDERVFVRSDDGVEEGRFIAREAPRYSLGLARDLARHVGLPADTLLLERMGEDRWRLAHFLGTVGGALLDGVLRRRGMKRKAKGRGGPFFTRVDGPDVPDDGSLGNEDRLTRELETELLRRRKTFAGLLQPGPFVECVPDALLDRWIRESVDVERYAGVLSAMRVVAHADGEA
ncbi:MAG: DEAD/DEAH box helicase [Myxococcota bacterium]